MYFITNYNLLAIFQRCSQHLILPNFRHFVTLSTTKVTCYCLPQILHKTKKMNNLWFQKRAPCPFIYFLHLYIKFTLTWSKSLASSGYKKLGATNFTAVVFHQCCSNIELILRSLIFTCCLEHNSCSFDALSTPSKSHILNVSLVTHSQTSKHT